MFYDPFVNEAEKYRFESIYRKDTAEWDIGRPQDPVRYLIESGQLNGEVIDVGCGTGLHSMYMASKGLDVLGVDFSPEAVSTANDRARVEDSSAEFLVWDALKLSDLSRSFDCVLDSAMMHCLNQRQRADYVEELEEIVRPGGKVFVICSQSIVSLWELEELFSEWNMVYVLGTQYTYTQSSIPAYLVCAEKRE